MRFLARLHRAASRAVHRRGGFGSSATLISPQGRREPVDGQWNDTAHRLDGEGQGINVQVQSFVYTYESGTDKPTHVPGPTAKPWTLIRNSVRYSVIGVDDDRAMCMLTLFLEKVGTA